MGDWLVQSQARLARTSDESRLETEHLLEHVAGVSRAAMIARPEAVLDANTARRLESLLIRRERGEPLAYLLGSREFWSLSLAVTPAVLIPRADTECLVERALDALEGRSSSDCIVDAGTGAGTIALALATECSQPIIATDVDSDALAIARVNAQRLLPPGRVCFVQGDWLAALADNSVAVLVSNPPYLSADDPHLPSLAAEPAGALVAGVDGLSAIRRLVADANRICQPGASVLFEHGCSQAPMVRRLLADHRFVDIATSLDLAGLERVTEARYAA